MIDPSQSPIVLIDSIPSIENTSLILAVILLVMIGVRETYRLVSSAGNPSDLKPDDLETGDDVESVDGDHETTSEAQAPSQSPTTDKPDSEGASSPGSLSLRDRLYFWRLSDEGDTHSEKQEEKKTHQLEGTSFTDDGLTFSTEFDEALNEELKEALADQDTDIEDVAANTELPPHLDDGDTEPEEFFCDVQRLHQRQIAPDRVVKTDTHYKLGKMHRRVLMAHEIPDVTPIAGLKTIIEDPSIHFDMTIHFHAIDQQSTLRGVTNLYRNLDAAVSTTLSEGDNLTAGDKALRKEKLKKFRDEMKQSNERASHLTLYVAVSHEDEEVLREKVDEIRDQFRTSADMRLKTIERKQKKALKSVSPLGIDPLYNDDNDIKPEHVCLGKSFGAIMTSLVESSKFEPSGHEWGVHSVQGHPIVKDPFKSSRNYNMVVVGESGTGKTLNTKRMALETRAVHPDTLIIMLDPLGGFHGLAEALDAKKVTIGGNQPINPMEIRKPSGQDIDSQDFDDGRDPFSSKVSDVMAWLQNYIAQQPGLKFGEESQLLRSLIIASYRQQGITRDVQTHDNPSPTLKDVFHLANHAYEHPSNWAKGPEEKETIRQHAAKIGTILREFTEGGQYENLATRPKEDIFGNNDAVYLDLSQQEASGGSGTGVSGQLLFSTAYELCKEHDGPAVYIIDEARFLFREADTLDYLAQRVRHSRHYDTSIRFITQEMDDFFEFQQAEGILHNSSFQVIHQSADVDDWGDHFDLKDKHKRFVKNAATGTQKDFSQALVRFPEKNKWYPLTIELGDRMLTIADFDSQVDRYSDLPGQKEPHIEISPVERELIARVRNDAKSHDAELTKILEDWERPIWDMLTTERAERCLERIADGDHPRKALYLEAVDQVRLVIEKAGGDEVAPDIADSLMEAIEQEYDETYNVGTNIEEIKRRLEEDNLTLGLGVSPN